MRKRKRTKTLVFSVCTVQLLQKDQSQAPELMLGTQVWRRQKAWCLAELHHTGAIGVSDLQSVGGRKPGEPRWN